MLATTPWPTVARAANGQEMRISLTILPAQDPASLPDVVRRLDAVQPGYGSHWAHARQLAATDPLQAVRSLRRIHESMLRQPGADALERDMEAAGQALLRPANAAAAVTTLIGVTGPLGS